MGQSISAAFINPVNAPVRAYIENLSAHSDIADTLLAAVKPLGGVQISCPDALAYRYLVVSTKGIIFGLTVGMNKIAIRLDEWMKICALVMGAVAFSECGDYWVSVQPLRGDADWPAVDLRFWALKAYAHERDKAWQITLPGWITGG